MDEKRLRRTVMGSAGILGAWLISQLALTDINSKIFHEQIALMQQAESMPRAEFASIEDARKYIEQEKPKLGLENVQINLVYTNQQEKITSDLFSRTRQTKGVTGYCQKEDNGSYTLALGDNYRDKNTADHEIYHVYDSVYSSEKLTGLARVLIPEISSRKKECGALDYQVNKNKRQAEIIAKLAKRKR